MSPLCTPELDAASSTLRRAWHGLTALVARIEDSLVGDVIACACLFATFFLLMIFAGVLA